jgi:hypothetical protein
MSTTTLDQAPYGTALASQVAAALEAGESISYAHKEYCGMGLAFRDGQFIYGELHDADFSPPPEVSGAVFRDRQEFVTWRINRERLEEVVRRARTPGR